MTLEQFEGTGVGLAIVKRVVEMSGPELAAKLRALDARLKVIYTSGYPDHAVVGRGLLDQTMSFLQKPFTPGELAQTVREVLDRRLSAT